MALSRWNGIPMDVWAEESDFEINIHSNNSTMWEFDQNEHTVLVYFDELDVEHWLIETYWKQDV